MKLEAARRLVSASLITEARVVMRAVLQYFRDAGIEAEYVDDAQECIAVSTDIADAVEILDAQRYTEVNDHVRDEGLYKRGVPVLMQGANFKLELTQHSGGVVICVQ